MRKVKNFFKRELVFSIFTAFLIVLSIANPQRVIEYPRFIDWKTLETLTGLLLITTAFKESEFFSAVSKRFLKRLKSERSLSIFLVSFSVLISTFLTNDIALFVVVPITLEIQSVVKNDISKLIVFEAIAVNVGSSLTPIGNPQNIFLWHRWKILPLRFVAEMLPVFLVLFSVLLLFTYLSFSKRKLEIPDRLNEYELKKSLFVISSILMLLFLIFASLGKALWFLPVVITIYLLIEREVLLKADWMLLLTITVIFIDFHLVSEFPSISAFIKGVIRSKRGVFLTSSILSQFLSNVPTSILMTKFSNEWKAIAYGVNVGGNGIAIASLANLIAIRLAKNSKLWKTFHVFSIPYFIVTLFLCLFSLFHHSQQL